MKISIVIPDDWMQPLRERRAAQGFDTMQDFAVYLLAHSIGIDPPPKKKRGGKQVPQNAQVEQNTQNAEFAHNEDNAQKEQAHTPFISHPMQTPFGAKPATPIGRDEPAKPRWAGKPVPKPK